MHKLTEIVISLWLEIIKLDKEGFDVMFYMEPFWNIVFGINGKCECKQVVDIH